MSELINERKSIVVVGDGTVGKTCLLMAYLNRQFTDGYIPTVFETHERTLEVDEESYNVMLYDTAGQEEFDKLRIVYLKNKKPDVIILCYSIDNKSSYKNVVEKWVPELKNRAPIVLVATKSDLRQQKRNHKNINYGKGLELKKKIKAFSFVECSSKNFSKIDSVFEEAVRAAIGKQSNYASRNFLSRVKIQILKLFCMY